MIAPNFIASSNHDERHTVASILKLHTDDYRTIGRRRLCDLVPFSEPQLSRIISGDVADIKLSTYFKLITKAPKPLADALRSLIPTHNGAVDSHDGSICIDVCDLNGDGVIDPEDLMRLAVKLNQEVSDTLEKATDALVRRDPNSQDAGEAIIREFNDVIEQAQIGREIARRWYQSNPCQLDAATR